MKKFLAILVIVFISLLSTTTSALAISDSNYGKIITLPAGEVINKDYFAAGDTVEIFGTVNGDVYTAGGQVIVNGTINGDLLVAGGTVSIGGNISDNVRAAAGQISVTAQIGKNLTIAGGNIEISDNANVQGNLVTGSGNLNILGPINGNINAGTGNLTISSPIGGDIEAAVGTMRINSQADITGNLNYWSSEPAQIDDSANIEGQVVFNAQENSQDPEIIVSKSINKQMAQAAKAISTLFKLTSLANTLLIGLLLIYFCPSFTQSTSAIIKSRPFGSLGVGLITLLITPIIIVLLAITIIGIPASVMLFMILLLYIYISRIYVMYLIGTLVSKKFSNKNIYLNFILGGVVYYFLTIIPIISSLTILFTLLIGLGALVINTRLTYNTARDKKIF